MENYELKTPVGEANIPKNSHAYVALNPIVSTLMRASDIEAGPVFFKKEYASDPFRDFQRFVDDEELHLASEMLYEKRNGTSVPLTRRALADFLSENETFYGKDLEKKVWEGSDFSNRMERGAVKYFESQNVPSNMKLSASEIRKLLSMNPGSPAQWPWGKLRAYGLQDFNEELQELARLYSRVETAARMIKEGTSEEQFLHYHDRDIDLSGLIALKRAIHPYDKYLRVWVQEKSESGRADSKVLTLEQDRMPEAIKPVFFDFSQLVEDAYAMETVAGTLLNTYLVNKKHFEAGTAYSTTKMALYRLMAKNAYVKEKYDDAVAQKNSSLWNLSRDVLAELKSGKIDASFFLPEGYAAGLINTFNYILLYVPEDFLQARNEKGKFLLNRISNPFSRDSKREEKSRRIRRLEKIFAEEFGMDGIRVRYLFSAQYSNEKRRNQSITGRKLKEDYARANAGFISKEEFLRSLGRYFIRGPDFVIEALFRDFD